MPGFASILAISAAAGARVASLNLCTDELLLLLARPSEIASLSYLSREPGEAVHWADARRYPANAGSLETVLTSHPTTVLTMGGGGRATASIARKMGLKVVDLSFAASLGDVDRQLLVVANALGDPNRADKLRVRLRRLQATAPRGATDAVFLAGGGLSIGAGSLGAAWMRLAGLRQRALSGDRVTLETLATDPPKVLLQSDYRRTQQSLGVAWLRHPLVRRFADRTRLTDGRPWTCAAAGMIPEIERLRRTSR